MKWTIGKKLFGGFGVVVLCTLVVGVVGIWVFNTTGHTFDDFKEDQTIMENLDMGMEARVQEQYGYVHYFYTAAADELGGAQEWGEEFDKRWGFVHAELSEHYKVHPGAFGGVNPEEVGKALDAIDAAMPNVEAELEKAIAAYKSNPAPENRELAMVHLTESQHIWEKEIEPHLEASIHPYVEGMMEEGYGAMHSSLSVGLLTVIIVTVLGVLAGLVFAFLISRGLSSRATALRNAAEEMSLGRLDVAVTSGGSDEITDLAVAFERLRTSMRAAIDRIKKR